MKPKQTVHVTVTVPKWLKRKMEAHRQARRVNWSKIACRAWNEYLKEHSNE